MTRAATAVAARMVENQKRRLPFSRKGLALRWGLGLGEPGVAVDRGWAGVRKPPDWPAGRRWGEIQGQIL